MIWLIDNNKIIKSTIKTNKEDVKNLYNIAKNKKIICNVKTGEEISFSTFKKFDDCINIFNNYVFLNYVYKNSLNLLRDILEKPNKNIELLKLLKNDISKLTTLNNILSDSDKDLAIRFIKRMCEDFYFFSTEVLDIIDFIPLNEYNIKDISKENGILKHAYNNTSVLKTAKTLNKIYKK